MKGGILMSKYLVYNYFDNNKGSGLTRMDYCDKSDIPTQIEYKKSEYQILMARVWKMLNRHGGFPDISWVNRRIVDAEDNHICRVSILSVYDKGKGKSRDLTLEDLKKLDELLSSVEEVYQKVLECQREYRIMCKETKIAIYSSLNIY